MNFISHFRGAMDKMANDERPLTSHHIALYQALFYYWNLNRFKLPLPVARDDIMHRARIGSKTTYHRCIHELDQWGYIRYEPSHNKQIRSMVHMYRFDKESETTSGTTSETANGTTSGTTSVPKAGQPFFNSIVNGINDKNKLNDINAYEHTHKNSNQSDPRREPDKTETGAGDYPERQSGNGDRSGKTANKAGAPNSLEEVEAYFADQNFSSEQAKRFFNYYSNRGWRLGKSERLMEDWRFAAENWILNAKQFDHDPNLKPGALYIPPDRDYQQPL